MSDRLRPPGLVRRPLAAVALAVASVALGGLLLAGCGPSTPTAAPRAVPVTFIYSIVGPDAGVAHTTHFQLLDAGNKLITETTLDPAGNVDTRTISLTPGIYSAISWDEEPGSPAPSLSAKCGSVFTVDPGLALVVTIESSRVNACLTDTREPGASQTPGDGGSPTPSAANPGPS
jgi:hypothetical protein